MKFYLSALVMCMVTTFALAQNLSVGFPLLEETARRQQLSSDFNAQVSFAIKPIAIDSSFKFPLELVSFPKKLGGLSLLPLQVVSEYHDHHPHPSYNGAMLPARGLQSVLSLGFAGNFGPISFQLKPEFITAQNKPYPGYTIDLDRSEYWNTRKWPFMYRWYNTIDLPEQFGVKPIREVLLGQSHIKVNYNGVAAGISSENLWWGPGKYNSLLMTNNARGFVHVSVHTTSPASTPVGSFEGQLVVGELQASGYLPPDTGRMSGTRKLYVPKLDESRYLNGISLVYQPKWVDGLFLGFGRVVQQYSSTRKYYNDHLPIITDIFRKSNHFGDTLIRDQKATVFFRWVGVNSEVYFEYGRNNASWKWRDLMANPQHDAAYVMGFTRLVALAKTGNFLEFNVELTKLQQPADYTIGLGKPQSWYTHEAVRHGYTHHGEVLGSRVGPGGNMQILEAGWVNGYRKITFLFERLVHNNDFVYLTFNGHQGGDFRRYWVDYGFGLNVNWAFNKLLVGTQFQHTRSMNYQWDIVPGLQYFSKGSGVDLNNFSSRINLAYLF